jgi:hypothetical protein
MHTGHLPYYTLPLFQIQTGHQMFQTFFEGIKAGSVKCGKRERTTKERTSENVQK